MRTTAYSKAIMEVYKQHVQVWPLKKNIRPDLLDTLAAMYVTCYMFSILVFIVVKVRKTERIRNRYNVVPHLSRDTKWESNKIRINITNKIQEVSPFSTGDHKAAMNTSDRKTNTRQNNKNDPQKR